MSRRKSTKQREPNGRIQREPKAPPPAAIYRVRQAALRRVVDPKYGTPFGWLFLSEQLTDAQYAAGSNWAKLAREYSDLCLAPKSPRTADLDPSKNSPTDPDSEEGQIAAQRETHTKHKYLAALSVLNSAGTDARGAVAVVCEYDQMTSGMDELRALRAGLHALANWYAGRTPLLPK